MARGEEEGGPDVEATEPLVPPEHTEDTTSPWFYTDSRGGEDYSEYVPCSDDQGPDGDWENLCGEESSDGASQFPSPAPSELHKSCESKSSEGEECEDEESPKIGREEEPMLELEACLEEAPSAAMTFVEEEATKDAIFVHSPPHQFPDIAHARKSVFGSIFVRAPAPKHQLSVIYGSTEDVSQFSMIPGFLGHRSKGSESLQSEKRSTHKGSVFRAFEKRGITETSGTSSSQWDVFPITKSALFSFQVNDRIHQTRYMSQIEDRIVNARSQILKFCHNWPTGSSWTGHWDGLGMAGSGTYVMPHEVCYIGRMHDGMCHDDDATLIYPNGFRATHCNYVNGELTDYQFQFPDALEHEKENWEYCHYPDRRFWSEVQNGLKPAKTAQKTQEDPPRKVPIGCYDTNDGFYNPKTKMLLSPDGMLLRVPTCEEEHWILSKCRKGFQEYTGFRPDLYENWFNDDKELIRSILSMRRRYLAGEITYEELNEFYAENDLLPSCSPHRKTRTLSEINLGQMSGNMDPPKKLSYRLQKRYRDCGAITKSTSLESVKTKKTAAHSGASSALESAKDAPRGTLPTRIKFREDKRTSKVGTASQKTKPSKPILKTSQRPSAWETTSSASRRSADSSSDQSNESALEHRVSRHVAKRIILDMVEEVLLREREKHRDRFVRTQSVGNLPFGPRDDKERCVQVLQELYEAIPDEDEFCDSFPKYDCDLRNLAEDRFQTVKYWGKRIFTLRFDEESCHNFI